MATIAQIMELYTAYFNRAADKDGVDYWYNEVTTNGWTLDQVAQSFADQAEYTTIYAGMTNAQIVAAVYTNVLNRTADTAGAAYWEAELEGGMHVKNLIQAVVNAAKEDVDGLGDDAVIANKTAVSQYYYDNNRNDTDVSLATITSDAATVASAKSTLDTTIASETATNIEAIQLTTSSDLILGTTGDDTINGLVGTNSATGALADTAQSVDIIDGGAGTDTLNISTQGGSTFGGTVTNVEKIVFTAYTADTFNMANTTGLESLSNKGSIANLTVTNAGNIVDLTAKNISGNSTIMTYVAAASAGLSDTQNVTLSNATNNHTIDLNDAGIETLAITSSGSANKVKFDDIGTSVKTITVDGDQDLTLAFVDTTVSTDVITTFNASELTGNLTVDLATAVDASNMAVTTGTGDDKVTFTNFTKDDSFDLGDGDDTLVLSGFTSVTTAATLSNIETIVFAAQTASATLAATNATALEKIVITGDDGTPDTVTVTKLASTFNTIVFDAMDGTVGADTWNNVNVALNNYTGTSDELNLVFQATDANGNHITSTKDTQKSVAAITANNIETINITAADMGANDNSTTDDSGLVITALNADSVNTLTITSDTWVKITGNLDDNINTVDATGAAGGVLLEFDVVADASHTTFADKSLTVNTGAGNDTLSDMFTTTAEVHTAVVNTGAGNDTIDIAGPVGDQTGSVDTLTIDAGTGNDTVQLLNATVATEATVSVTLGDGVDTVQFIGDGTQTGITIADFVVGSGGDKIDMATNASQAAGAGAALTGYVESTTGAIAATTGIVIYTGNDLASADEAGIEDLFDGTTSNYALNAASDEIYLFASDGTNGYLFYLDCAVTDTEFTAADDVGTLIATFTGVSDASALTVDNFTDFLA